ncbi:hypothetical protein [Hymenobacter psychrophilus]|uniref:hypothetical protein n=1 Tax=Hymenobacter psychrophilus TaxID=651662 RepID=UPI0011150189|nr:hypothetical protein [Hymenobacter psychrophilus]
MTKWYSVNHNGNYKEYISLTYAEAADGITVVEQDFIQNNYKGLKYYFHYEDKLNTGVKIGYCQIVRINTRDHRYVDHPGCSVYAVFSDRDGVKIEPNSCFGESINGVANAVKYIAEINKDETLEKHTLLKKVEELSSKVELLESELLSIKETLVSDTAPSQ